MKNIRAQISDNAEAPDRDYLLYLLNYAGPEGISGRVRFQKIVFILKEGLGIPFSFKFAKRRFGPFSDDLMNVVTQLKLDGLITEKKLGTQYIYCITEEGHRYSEEIDQKKIDMTAAERIDRVLKPMLNIRVDDLTNMAYAIAEAKK